MTLEDTTNSPSGEIDFPPSTIDEMERLGLTSVDSYVRELKVVFQERIPYIQIPKIDGPCYKWNDEFIDNIMLAMATDRLDQMSEDELIAWRYFVNFQNYHTHSALDTDANGTSIGCTIPDSQNRSFVVAFDGTITTTRCQNPGYEIEGETIWKSLDKALMSTYNCEQIDSCIDDNQLIDVAPCSI